jgi:hypothetical protein
VAAFLRLLFGLHLGKQFVWIGAGRFFRHTLTILLFYSIQSQIEFQYVHTRLAQEAQLASF